MTNTSYKFDELVELKRDKPKTFMYIYFAIQGYYERINKPK